MIVLDAAAWVDILVAGAAAAVLDDEILVPPHFDAEVIGTLRALGQRGVLPPGEVEVALDRHLRAPVTREFTTEDIQAAWRWKDSMSIADAWCPAVARRKQATWVTANQRAADTASRLGVIVTTV